MKPHEQLKGMLNALYQVTRSAPLTAEQHDAVKGHATTLMSYLEKQPEESANNIDGLADGSNAESSQQQQVEEAA
mgnify:FL=1|jgi:hypothetical protein